MNLQQLLKHAPITLFLIISFVSYALWQLLNGVSLDSPTNQQLITYGANFLPLTLLNEPWRMLSSGFLHIGLMHLLFNSFAMYYFGVIAEWIVGRWRFLALFLLSVIGGNALNLIINWQKVMDGDYPTITAGASGGIMGIGMALLIISVSQLPITKTLNRRSLTAVMAMNILIGFALPNIDTMQDTSAVQ